MTLVTSCELKGLRATKGKVTPNQKTMKVNKEGNHRASSGETHGGTEESAWLGSGYYYVQMLPSYVVIFANILALITGISTLICMTND